MRMGLWMVGVVLTGCVWAGADEPAGEDPSILFREGFDDDRLLQRVNYQRWNKGVSSDPSFFPIAVWLQAPKNAERFRKAGINLYVGLWRGPTEEQLRALKAASHE